MREVIVIGAGPAGSTAANVLATAGRDVLVLEKEEFPRFHIGESLLPIDLPIFARIGFEPARADYVYKAGADFVDETNGQFAQYLFDDGLEGSPKHAWQVERARFDHDLAKGAERRGAEIRYGVKVNDVSIEDDRVRVSIDGAELEARYLLDATGQDAFLGRRRRALSPIKGFGIIAAFTHFDGLGPDAVAELESTGNIRVLIREEGWGWLIPLRGARLSFGIVSRKQGEGAQMVTDAAASSPLVTRLTAGATMRPPRLLRHWAYVNRENGGHRHLCIGDAAAFLDPVFSSGVSLAMLGGELAAERLVVALADRSEGNDDLMKPVQDRMRRAYDSFGSLIQAFYNTRLVQHFFFNDAPDPALRSGLISLLAGDVWREDNRFQESLLNGRRRWSIDSYKEP
jgi:flavin-dependent dehydrogenase